MIFYTFISLKSQEIQRHDLRICIKKSPLLIFVSLPLCRHAELKESSYHVYILSLREMLLYFVGYINLGLS